MIGCLPKSVEVNGKEWEIDSDYRNILRIFDAMNDEELSNEEKLYVALARFYKDFDHMEKNDYAVAYEQLSKFMECHDRSSEKKSPQLIDWQKDEHMIFPAINKVAGCEVRSVEYMHWWTFLGYFENVDNESLWSFVLSIRQKRAKGKKLEKHEQEFYTNNRELCSVKDTTMKAKQMDDDLAAMFNMLTEGG